MLDALLGKLNGFFSPCHRRGLRVGSWRGVEVWLHWWLLLFAVVLLLQSVFQAARGALPPAPVRIWLLQLAVLVPSLLLHEIGHLLAVSRRGGRAENFVLSPVGGLEPCEIPPQPLALAHAAWGGPMATASLLLVAGLIAVLSAHPFLPVPAEGGEIAWGSLLVQYAILWNVCLLLLNAIPCRPLDAGSLLHAFLWARSGSRLRALDLAMGVSRLLAICCLIAAGVFIVLSLTDGQFPRAHPVLDHLTTGFLLVGLIHFQESRRLREDDLRAEEESSVFGYDFSQGYTSLRRSLNVARPERKPTFVERWRREARRKERERETREDRDVRHRLDDLLQKIHRDGMSSLTRAERKFLGRASRHVQQGLERRASDSPRRRVERR